MGRSAELVEEVVSMRVTRGSSSRLSFCTRKKMASVTLCSLKTDVQNPTKNYEKTPKKQADWRNVQEIRKASSIKSIM